MSLLPIQKPQQQEKDPLDRIIQGLQIAQSGFGIGVDISKLQSMSQERDINKQKAPIELAGLQAKADAEKAGAQMAAILKPLQIRGAQLENETKQRNLDMGTPDQSKAALFGRRMEQAEKVFGDLGDAGFSRADISQGALSLLPEGMQPGSLQQQNQAERNFLNAVLRRESGAAISPKEIAEGAKQYFPRGGDSPEVAEQKRQNRALALAGMRAEAGQAFEKIPPVDTPPRAAKSNSLIPEAIAAKPPAKGAEMDGYLFLGGDPANPKSWRKK